MGLYYAAVFLVKLSLLALYFRAFSSPAVSIRKRLDGLFGKLILFNLALLLLWTGFVSYFWAAEEGLLGFDRKASLIGVRGSIAVGWMNAFTDLCLLAVPLYAMHRVQLRRKDKISIYCILLLGLIAAGASAIRSAYGLRHEYDSTISLSAFNFARFTSCSAEACLGYTCFCLPAFRGLAEALKGWVDGFKGAWDRVGRPRRRQGNIRGATLGPVGVRRVRGEQSSQIELVGWGRV